MPLHIEWARQSALMKRIEAVQAAGRPGSKAMNRAMGDIRKVVVEDHRRMLLTGIDRFGKQRAALSPVTLANPKRKPGPSLIPGGAGARFLTHCEVAWLPGAGGANATVLTLVKRYVNLTTKDGRDLASIHEHGATITTRSGRTIVIPARETLGITPQGLREVDGVVHNLGIDILKGA